MLRKAGFAVLSIKEQAPGLDDASILAWATRTGRVLLTQGRDYGALVFRHGMDAQVGIIYFRLADRQPETPALLLMRLLEDPNIELSNTLCVLEDDRVRFVPIS